MDAIITVDASQRITLFNAAAERMFGYTAELMLGQPLEKLIPQRYHSAHSDHLRRFGETGQTQRAMGDHGTQLGVRANGEEFPIEASISQVEIGGQKFFTAVVRDVSSRISAERALADSRAQLASIVSSAMDAIITVDEGQRITLYNHAAEKMFGYKGEMMLGRSLDVLIPARYCGAHGGHIRKFAETGVTSRAMGKLSELTALRANGEEFPIEASISQVEISGRRLFTVILRDLTSRLRAEQELRDSQLQYKRIVETTHEGIWLIDKDNVTTYVNPRMAEMLGYEPSEMLGRPLQEFVEPNAYKVAQENIRDQREGAIQQLDYQFLHKNGSVVDVLVATNPIFDEVGGFLGSQAMCTDITARKHAEAALLESQREYKRIVETSLEGIWVTNRERLTTYVNPRMAELLGYSVEEMIGKSGRDFMFEEDIERVETLAAKFKSEGIAQHLDMRFKRKDGTPLYVLVAAKPTLGPDGEYQGALSMCMDVSDRKFAEEERAKMERQFMQAQKMEAIGTLAGGIAHDFNNILGAIQGYGELVLETIEPGSQAYLDQQEVLQASERASQLVRQILTFSRKTPNKRVLVSLPLIVKEVAKLMRATLPSTVEVRLNIELEEALVSADPIEIHQILVNLCTNAGFAMQDNGGVLEVSLRHHSVHNGGSYGAELDPGDYYLLGVADTGMGIPPEIIGRIFEPFFTTKEAGEGTGLGLATVHGVAKNLGGKVTVYSELGQGTTFHVYLPATEGRHTEEVRPELVRGTERILLVDDEPALARLGKSILEGLGYLVHTETSSIAALSLFQSSPADFDLIVTDETVPKLKGTEMARFIADIRPDLPILLCTGYGQEIEGIPPSIRAVLHKPVSRAELSRAIREALQDR